MRARRNFTYTVEKVIEPSELFNFIQEELNLSDSEMYQTFNMGMDYALFLDKKDVEKTLEIIRKEGFFGIDAGYIEEGEKQVIIKPKNIIFKGKTFKIR